jgi:DNA modification methylase
MSGHAIQTGMIYCDDNHERVASLPSESVDLIYLDPPFFSNRKYEVIWGDEAEMRSFEDRWEGGIQVYVAWMRERLLELHRVLKPSGSFYLHADWHAGHYLKVMLDEIFGYRQFRNQVVWHYTGWNKRLRGKFESRHDMILFYAKGKPTEQVFNSWTRPWASVEEYVKVRKQKVRTDENDRAFVLSDGGSGTRVRRYLDEAMEAGVFVDDVWDIDKVNNSAKEAMGYPTQKPEELLRRIIEASSNENDVVLDPFAGCGTALVAAQTLHRRWIGIDISPTACRVMRDRLAALGASVTLEGMPVSEGELRALRPFEFQNIVIATMNGTHAPRKSGDMGIDGFSWFEHHPIQVKQSDHVGRNVVDNFETAIERNGSKTGYIVAFSFTRGAREEVARVRAVKGIDIRLTLVVDLFRRDQAAPTLPNEFTIPARPAAMQQRADTVPDASKLVESIRRGLAEQDERAPDTASVDFPALVGHSKTS